MKDAIPPVSCMNFCICMYACSLYNILVYLYLYISKAATIQIVHFYDAWLMKSSQNSEDASTEYHKINN